MAFDTRGQEYQEVDLPDGALRLTRIPEGWNGTPTIRFQIRDQTGHLRPGPEIPQAALGEVFGAIIELVATRTA